MHYFPREVMGAALLGPLKTGLENVVEGALWGGRGGNNLDDLIVLFPL